MPRSGSGSYTLPTGNPVVSGTTIEASWANNTLNDVATTLTDSLSRSGQGGMTAAFRAADGSASVPGVAWSSETGTGFYRAGSGDTRFVVTTTEVQKWLSTGTAITGTLSATGNLSTGTASPVFGSGSGVEIERAGIATLRLENSSASNSFELYADSAANGINLRGRDSSPMNFWTGNTLQATLDSSGNLGLGVTPSAWRSGALSYDVARSSYADENGTLTIASNAYRATSNWLYKVSTFATRMDSDSGQFRWYTAPSGTAGNAITFAQNMGLSSTSLDVNSGYIKIGSPATSTDEFWLQPGSVEFALRGRQAKAMTFWTSDAEKMRLDSSGNLGLGVTPSAWGGTYAGALQVKSAALYSASDLRADLASNAFYNGTAFTYINTGFSTALSQVNGQFRFFTAPSGTAGNAISFTQAMTLDASGRLLVGNVGGLGQTQRVQAEGDYLSYGDNKGLRLLNSATTGGGLISANTGADGGIQISADAGPMLLSAGGSERARITSGGAFLAGKQVTTFNTDGVSLSNIGSNFSYTSGAAVAVNRNGTDGNAVEFYKAGVQVGTISVTGSATAYNTSSDYRLKDNPQPLTGSGAFIDALQPKTWEWKADGSRGVGFIAHEAQAVSPSSVVGEKDAVDEDGKPVMQAMEYGSAEFIANIIAELQSLRARVAALEAA